MIRIETKSDLAPDVYDVDGQGRLHYTDPTNASRTLYISGQIPETADGSLPADFESQARLCWQNIEAQLNVENLLDERYYPTSHGNNNIGPGAPRTLIVSLAVTP